MFKEYQFICQNYMKELRENLKIKRKNKIVHLIGKWKKKSEIPKTYRSIKVGDEELPIEFESQPRVYGGIELDKDEVNVLKLPPKFSLYSELSKVNSDIEVEMCLNKLRWNIISGKVERENLDEEDRIISRSGQFIDEKEQTIDINQLRVTELPYNYKTTMPKPLGEEELKLNSFKRDVREVIENIHEESKSWQNMGASERKGLKKLKQRMNEYHRH